MRVLDSETARQLACARAFGSADLERAVRDLIRLEDRLATLVERAAHKPTLPHAFDVDRAAGHASRRRRDIDNLLRSAGVSRQCDRDEILATKHAAMKADQL